MLLFLSLLCLYFSIAGWGRRVTRALEHPPAPRVNEVPPPPPPRVPELIVIPDLDAYVRERGPMGVR